MAGLSRWDQVAELLAAAEQLPPEKRRAFLREQTSDAAVLAEVESLLATELPESDLLEKPAFEWYRPQTASSFEPKDTPPRLLRGEVLAGRFEIESFLGRGGMGEVYAANDRELKERIALKLLHPELAGEPGFLDRFRREIRLARRISHPNVARVFDLVQAPGHPLGPLHFYILELLEGETLRERLKRDGAIAEREAREIARQIASGLAAVHAAGVIHRDFKPSNVILTGGRAVVTDFGLAAQMRREGSDSSLRTASLLMGTPGYVAPEQWAGQPATEQTDVYSFGIVLHEIITGRHPNDPGEKLTGRWARVIEKCLDPVPAKRWKGPLEAVEALAPRWYDPYALNRRQMLAGGVAAGAAAGIFGYLRVREPRVSGLGSEPAILLADATGDSRAATAVMQMRKVLAQSESLTLWDNARLNDVWKRMRGDAAPAPTPRDWREIALREGVPLVLFTSLGKVGDAGALVVRLEQVKGRPDEAWKSWQQSFEVQTDGMLLARLSEAGRWVRRKIGESESDIAASSAHPEAVTTPSWVALADYTKAEQLAVSDRQAAVFALRSAIDKDPDFTMAWMRTGDLEVNLGHEQAGYIAWQKAVETSARRPLTRREDLHFRSMLASDAGDFKQSEQLFRQYDFYYPKDIYGKFFRAAPLMALGRAEEAIALLESCATIPERRRFALAQIVVGHLYNGNRAGAEEAVARIRKDGNTSWAARMQSLIHYCFDETDKALATFDEAAADPRSMSPDRATYYRSGILADGGRTEEATRLALDSAHANARSGNTDSRIQNLVSAAYLLIEKNQIREAASLMDGIDTATIPPRQLGRVAHVRAIAGTPEKAEPLLSVLPIELDFPRFHIPRLRVTGEIAIARGKQNEGLALIRRAAALDLPGAGKEYLADALLRTGDKAGAAEEFKAVLRAKPFQMGYFPQDPAGTFLRAKKMSRS